MSSRNVQEEVLKQLKDGILSLANNKGLKESDINIQNLSLEDAVSILSGNIEIPLKAKADQKDLKDQKDVKGLDVKQALECCVCFDETTDLTKCGHSLCATCLKQLVTAECPSCRKPLESIDPKAKEIIDRRGANRAKAIEVADRIKAIINSSQNLSEEEESLSYNFYLQAIPWLSSAYDQRDNLLRFDNKLDLQGTLESLVLQERAKTLKTRLKEILEDRMGGSIPNDVKFAVDTEINSRINVIDREDKKMINQMVMQDLQRLGRQPSKQELQNIYEQALYIVLWRRYKRCEDSNNLC